MERTKITTRLELTHHAIVRLQERVYPGISEERARQLLLSLAKSARPLKRYRNYRGEA